MREYNHSYNYFAGMSDDAVARYQKDAVTGHRPTWKMGFNGGGAERMFGEHGPADPFDVVREFGPGGRPRVERPAPEQRTVRNAERKAFDTLGLDIDAAAADIKARFKELVKRHHPDANGGDRSLRRPAARDHPGVQLSEVGEILLTGAAACPALPRSAASVAGSRRVIRATLPNIV